MERLGRIVVLNGAPRAGKSSIARAMGERLDGLWIALGVDTSVNHMIPPRLHPSIGLRPGGERPDLEDHLPKLYLALYDSIAGHSRLGLNIVADFGHHDEYSRPLGILWQCAHRLAGLSAFLVGVRCPIETIMARRRASVIQGDAYASADDDVVPAPVTAWQRAVHEPGIYDLELDTSRLSPEECAASIEAMVERPSDGRRAFERLAAQAPPISLGAKV